MRRLQYLALFILAILLTACGTGPKRDPILNTLPTPFPTAELLIAPPTMATPTAWLSPMSATAKAMIDLYHPDVAYGVPITPLPGTSVPPQTNFEPVNINGLRIDYLGCYREKCFSSDKNCVVFQYRFTNNSDKTTSFMTGVGTKVFQGGVEMEFNSTVDSELLTDVRPGSSINVKDSYELRNADPMVEIEFSALFDLWSEPVIRKVTLP